MDLVILEIKNLDLVILEIQNLDLVILEIQPMKKDYLILVRSSWALLVFLLYSANGRLMKMSMKRKACQICQFFHQEFQVDCFGVKPRLSHYEAVTQIVWAMAAFKNNLLNKQFYSKYYCKCSMIWRGLYGVLFVAETKFVPAEHGAAIIIVSAVWFEEGCTEYYL